MSGQAWHGRRLLGLVAIAITLLAGAGGPPAPAEAGVEPPFTTDFRLEDCTFASKGRNTYFILEPGYQQVFAGQEGDTEVGLTITVLAQTRRVGNVETRVVHERHTEDGEVVELSWNYFAICRQTNAVFYFGEEVDIIEDGEVVSHDGAWLAGAKGARPGLIMPGQALLGARYFQEIAPGAALDRAEIISNTETVRTPAGRFTRCLKTVETTPLEPGVMDFKFYAPGVGLIQDGPVKLVRVRQAQGEPPDDDDDDD